jgi:23S rRNA pseudouridine1911/1915/1917 synthase
MSLNDGYVYRERVAPPDAGAGVLAYHAARFPHSSLETWRATIEAGRVRVNELVADTDQILCAGDRLEFHRPPWEEPEAPLTFEVVFEDDDVLVVEKPSGLQVLPAAQFYTHTLLHIVQRSAPERAEAAPVHRLGRGTSGLILFGKNAASRSFLSKQFIHCTAQKTYLALAEGTALPISCIARHPIGKRKHGPLDIHCVTDGGKASATRLRVLSRDAALDRSLVAAQPITGRPDQIRVHLAACGAPIVGDPLFGIGGVPKSDAKPGDGGYFLHAAALSIVHPATKRVLKTRSRPAWL